MVYADLLQTVEQRNKVMPSQLIPQVDRPWWCLRVICQVEVKRLGEGFEQLTTFITNRRAPAIDNHLLGLRGARITDPPMTVAGDPLQRLTAMAGHEERNFRCGWLGNQIGSLKRAAGLGQRHETAELNLAKYLEVFAEQAAALLGVDTECRKLYRTVTGSHAE